MNGLKKTMSRIWLVWAGFWFVIFFLLTYPFLYLSLLSKKTYFIAHHLRKIWGKISCVTGFIYPIIKYESPLPKNQQLIFASNHMSYIDILICGSFLPGFNFFMGKVELSRIPLFGIWFKTLDIAVHRESLRGSYKAFLDAGNQMEQLGANLIIFPEGRIPDDTPKLKYPFKVGAFRLAIETQFPIVPVTLLDNLKRFDSDQFVGSPGRARMIVHQAIETKGLTLENIPALQEKVYHIINSTLISHKII